MKTLLETYIDKSYLYLYTDGTDVILKSYLSSDDDKYNWKHENFTGNIYKYNYIFFNLKYTFYIIFIIISYRFSIR